MAEVAIIIGNGLDIDLGLPSRYSDFIQSDEWKKIAKNPNGYVGDENYVKHSLICYLQEKAYNKENWFDIEEEIHNFVIEHTQCSERNIKDNIRNQGISVTDLYNNLWTFDFIHTKKIYEKNESEISKWYEMMRRLMTKEHRGVKVRQ